MSKILQIRFIHDFYSNIKELEVILCIDGVDYATRDIDIAISNIKDRISKQYYIDFNNTNNVDNIYNNTVVNNEVNVFVDNIFFMYNKICGSSHYFLYSGKIPVNLSKVNYMGITKDSMLGVLKLLQVEGNYEIVVEAMEQIKYKIGTVPMCNEKRLFMLLYVSYILKLYELTSVIAQILYIGGI